MWWMQSLLCASSETTVAVVASVSTTTSRRFVADHTAHSRIGYWHDTVVSVCLSVRNNVHNQQSDKSYESDLLKFVHNQIQICSDAYEKRTDFSKPHPSGMWHQRSSSQFQIANHKDWSIVGYNDVIVCITVIESDECVLFYRPGSILSNKSDRSNCWLWTQPICSVVLRVSIGGWKLYRHVLLL